MAGHQVLECRICHKGDISQNKDIIIMLTCGLCKRHTHHTCLQPPMRQEHLVLLLRAMTSPGAPQLGHPRVWICPRCSSRNPAAAKETVLGRALVKPSATLQGSVPSQSASPSSSSGQFGQIPGSSHRLASEGLHSEQNTDTSSINTRPSLTGHGSDPMVVDDDLEEIEVLMAPAHSNSNLSAKGTKEVVAIDLESDDDIEVVEGPSLVSGHTSQRDQLNKLITTSGTSQASGSNTALGPSNRHPLLLDLRHPSPASGSSSRVLPRGPKSLNTNKAYHLLPPKPVFGSPISHLRGTTSKGVRRSNFRRRAARSPESGSDSGSSSFPVKRRKTDGHKERATEGRELTPTSTVALPDIRAIQGRLRAEGKLAPPPSHVYSDRWLTQTSHAAPTASSVDVDGTTAGRPHRTAPRIPSDDSDMGELVIPNQHARSAGADKGKEQARTPLFLPESEESDDGRYIPTSRSRRKKLADVKGKGRATETADEEYQIKVKLEHSDRDVDVRSETYSTPGIYSKKSQSRDPDQGLLTEWLRERQQDTDSVKWNKLLENRKFRLVERHESGILAAKKNSRLKLRAGVAEEDSDLQWVSAGLSKLHVRNSEDMSGIIMKREIPTWML